MTRRLAALGAVALLALTGCANQPAAAPVTVTSPAVTSAAPRTSAPAEAATSGNPYGDWAAEQAAPVAKWLNEWDSAECSAVDLAVGEVRTKCMVLMGTGTVVAKNYADSVSIRFDPDEDKFLGYPESDEQSDLLTALSTSTGTLAAQVQAFEEKGCLTAPTKKKCPGVVRVFVDNMNDVNRDLTALASTE